MVYYKNYNNGLRLVVNKIEGLYSVSIGVIVKTGSVNETQAENGISHFIEHSLFKGTTRRSAFEISDFIDRIGAQINAFTSKELTCYYTKSTVEHQKEALDVLSDIFFNSTLKEEELEKEKNVVIEEINMSEDNPEDLCFELLSESYYGNQGLGRTILGSAKNVKSFGRTAIYNYMDKYYTADNVVISVAGNVNFDEVEKLVKDYFADKFTRLKSEKQVKSKVNGKRNMLKQKPIEQSHIGLSMKGIAVDDARSDAFNIANTVLGGGMSSRLFQKIREDMGLSYNVYSYPSQYKDSGVLEIYAGVNTELRDKAFEEIIKEIKNFKKGVSEDEFLRGKEQLKSGFIMGRESTVSQMLLYGKYLLFFNTEFDFEERLKLIDGVSFKNVNDCVKDLFDLDTLAVATVGPNGLPLKI